VANDGYVPPVIYMELRINAMLVAKYPGDGPEYLFGGGEGTDGVNPPSGLAVMFDSTRFVNDSDVTVEFEAWCADGSYYYDAGSAQVANWATLYGIYDLEVEPLFWVNGQWYSYPPANHATIEPIVRPSAVAIGYGIQNANTSLGWNAYQLLGDFRNANVFYVHTHGTPNNIWSDTDDHHFYHPGPYTGIGYPRENIWPTTAAPTPLNAQFVFQPERVIANGSGLPPYNSTGQPPITLAHFQTCGTHHDNYFAAAVLYPEGNAYTGRRELVAREPGVLRVCNRVRRSVRGGLCGGILVQAHDGVGCRYCSARCSSGVSG